jgi:hypothetical protein
MMGAASLPFFLRGKQKRRELDEQQSLLATNALGTLHVSVEESTALVP